MDILKYKWYIVILLIAAVLAAYVVVAGTNALGMARAVKNSCSDSDGGNVIAVFGTTSGYYKNKLYTYNDYCINSGTIMEYYCNGVYQTNLQQSCGTDGYAGSYCLNGNVYKDFKDYYCSSGACSSTKTPRLQQTCSYGCFNGVCNSPPADSCSDTDGGNVPYAFGTTSGYLNSSSYRHSDYCVNSNNIMEYYCSGNYERGSQQGCPYGCADGICNQAQPNSCNDTDGGFVPPVRGTVTGYSSGTAYSYIDTCVNSRMLSEWYCIGAYAYNAGNYTCAGNFTACINGACI